MPRSFCLEYPFALQQSEYLALNKQIENQASLMREKKQMRKVQREDGTMVSAQYHAVCSYHEPKLESRGEMLPLNTEDAS